MHRLRRHNRRFRPPTALEALERRQLLAANVTSFHVDQASSGLNANETLLTPKSVNPADFGKLSTVALDGQVYAQPLYLENVAVAAGPVAGTHNLVFDATEHDGVYAIDANTSAILWQTSFLDGVGVTTVPPADVDSNLISPEYGITSTPVIDPSSNTLFVVAYTKEVRADGPHYVYRLHALDVSNGSEKLGGPATLADTLVLGQVSGNQNGQGLSYQFVTGPAVPGAGAGSAGGQLSFNALWELQRPGLTLAGGHVYMAFGSHGDMGPAHGWLLSVNAQTLAIDGVFNATPNGEMGSIWQSANSVTADAQGNLYVSTGNGTFETKLDANGFPVAGDYGDSVLKLATDPQSSPASPNANGWGLKVVDYFTPFNERQLDVGDADLGSGGIVLLADGDGSAAHPHLLVTGGKQGTLYLIDRDHMGKFDATADHVVEEVPGVSQGIYVTPAHFGPHLYFAGEFEQLKSLDVAKGVLSTTPWAASSDTFGFPGATPVVSSNATADGVVWAMAPFYNQLRAYDASNPAIQFYTSDMSAAGRDRLGKAIKFSVPAVADGEVFVGTANSLNIYGLLRTRQDQQYVAAVYADVLGRPVDANALDYWRDRLVQGLGRAELATILAHSDEYYANVIIAPAYQRFLGRVPDAGGVVYWVDQFQHHGLTDERFEADFVGSPEFYHVAGNDADDTWVEALYASLLGRPADPQGTAYWVGQLEQGAKPWDLAYAFISGVEHERQRISDDYVHYLSRQPDQAGIDYWLNQFAHGETNEELIAAFVASDEFFLDAPSAAVKRI